MDCLTQEGSPSSPPLVFFHGLFGCKEDWKETISHLKDDFCCLAFDLPGHGSSGVETDIASALKFLDLQNAPLVGYSMGGRIALSLQFFSPLILIAAHPGLSSEEEKLKRWTYDQHIIEKLLSIPLDQFLNEWYSQPMFSSLKTRDDLFERALERRKKQDPRRLASALERFSLAKQKEYKTFPEKTLYLYGKEDLKFEALSRTLPPSVKTQKIEGSGHAVHLERPKELALHIKRFLA